jgi:hypothetical protein
VLIHGDKEDRMRSMRALAMAGSAAVLWMAACGGGSGNGISTPTGILATPFPETTLPSGLPTALPSGIPTDLSSLLPSGVPTGNVGSLTQGTAHLEISGGATATVDLPTLKTGVFAPGTALGMSWTDDKSDVLAIGGIAFTGSATTSTTLVLSFAVTSPQLLAAASTAGECTMTLTDATASHVQGTADCQNLQVSGQSLTLHADFEASS